MRRLYPLRQLHLAGALGRGRSARREALNPSSPPLRALNASILFQFSYYDCIGFTSFIFRHPFSYCTFRGPELLASSSSSQNTSSTSETCTCPLSNSTRLALQCFCLRQTCPPSCPPASFLLQKKQSRL